jgi:prevent-host-death family protein
MKEIAKAPETVQLRWTSRHGRCLRKKLDMDMFMTKNIVMIMANIHDAKARLSEYLSLVEKGEVVIICKRNVPIAELRSVPNRVTERRAVGFMKGEFSVPESFFEPLPHDLLDSFEGTA